MTIGIVFGSDSGHARDCAIDIYYHMDQSIDIKIISSVTEFSDYEILIFIVSTSGYGAFPRNFIPIWNKLTKTDMINKYCVFGLGDSRYRKYNYAARMLGAFLYTIGAELLPLTLGDDQDPLGYRAMFEPWKLRLFEALKIIPKIRFPSIFNVSILNTNTYNESTSSFHKLSSAKTNCSLIRSSVVVDNSDKKVAELDIRLDKEFNLGDVISIYYKVDGLTIDKLLKRFRLTDVIVYLTIADNNYSDLGYGRITSGKYRLTTLFENYFDINSRASPLLMKMLSPLAKMDLHEEKLREFGTSQGLYLFNKYAEYERRTLLDILLDFDSIDLTLEQLINITPPLYPRLYSIANVPGFILPSKPTLSYNQMFATARLMNLFSLTTISSHINTSTSLNIDTEIENFNENKRIAQICVALVENYTFSGKRVLGRCSNWLLHGLSIGDEFFVEILSSCISFETRNAIISKPCIFLSTGTGFTSCRPWLQHKLLNSSQNKHMNLVIAGFRRRRNDLLFANEWYQYSRIAKIDIAYSREMFYNGNRFYIQNLLPRYSDDVWDMLLKGSVILVSGRSHPMPSNVLDALADILTHYHFSFEQAMQFIGILESTNRIIFETW